MSKKHIQSDEKVPLKLTSAERKLVLEGLLCLDSEIAEIIRGTPNGKPVMMTLDDLDDFAGFIAAEANHCDDKKKQQKLDTICEKIEDLLDKYTNEDASTISIEQARGKFTKAISDVLAGNEPEIISFQLPTPKNQLTEKYPIKTTPLQREALISYTRLKASIKRKFKESLEGPQVIEFTKKELDHMIDELGQAAVHAPGSYKKRLVAVQKKVADILNELNFESLGMGRPKKRRQPSNPAELLFQFKITLQDIEPTIWRRIQVRDCTLGELHEHIQTAMGWENYHMHQFIIDGERYGVSFPDDVDFGVEVIDEETALLSQLLPKSGKKTRWMYEYDFGDGWQHEVLFEAYAAKDKGRKYPFCSEGERACPPEDIGGVWGYSDYLEALADSSHEQHEEFLEWRGPFDPEKFDVEKVTREMRKA